MSYTRRSDEGKHQEVAALMPWFVNGSIQEHDRQRVEEHLLLCSGCREELSRERRLYESMSAEPAVEYMPTASLKRLQARLDGVAEGVPVDAPVADPAAAKAWRPSMPWQSMMAASVAVMAVAVSWLVADRWMQAHGGVSAPNYRTVTNPTPHLPNEVIRAVFSPTITLVEMQAVLDEAGLRIISGPTEAGVYALAANSRRPVSSSLTALRGHAIVRFAESVQPNEGASDTP
jgi:Putative zinc-finger